MDVLCIIIFKNNNNFLILYAYVTFVRVSEETLSSSDQQHPAHSIKQAYCNLNFGELLGCLNEEREMAL